MLTYQAFGLNVKTQTTLDMEKELMIDPHEGTSLYLLYWYKSTNTD
jgi:hypothetical protein